MNTSLKNLIETLSAEYLKRSNEFQKGMNPYTTVKEILDTWMYKKYLTKANIKKEWASVDELKNLIFSKYTKKQTAAKLKAIAEVAQVFEAGDLVDIKIQMEWKRSATSGSNPTAEMWYTYRDVKGNLCSNYFKSRSISGCGYDKGSTAVAECLNECMPLLKALYQLKGQTIEVKNHILFGYGSGYGILPNIEGGVGVNCYDNIFNKIGFEFKTVASGKNFDVYSVTKKA